MDKSLQCLTINLQHCKAASANLVIKLNNYNNFICLIQEPWVCRGKICGLGTTHSIYRTMDKDESPRACIVTSRFIKSWQLTGHCNRDQVVILTRVPINNREIEIVFCSKYMPYDSVTDPPDQSFIELVDYCTINSLALIIGSDTNAHHIAWGSTNINNRGQALMDYLMTTTLIPMNIGNKPTFYNYRRSEVLDVTMANRKAINYIEDWKVLDDTTFSDHKYISFKISSEYKKCNWSRHPQKTNWSKYSQTLQYLIQQDTVPTVDSIGNIDIAINKITKCMNLAFNKACPQTKPKKKKSEPWWNNSLKILRQTVRRKERRAFITKDPMDFNQAREAKINYRKELRKSKREAWITLCERTEGMRPLAKMNKILKEEKYHQIGMLLKEDGNYTKSPEESINLLADTHFADCNLPAMEHIDQEIKSEIIDKFINKERILEAINQFRPYKTPGIDGIFPIMLQKAPGIVIAHLIKIYRASLCYGYTAKIWKDTKIIFIPKPNRERYDLAKSFRPISLTSFVFKTLERLIKQYLDEKVLKEYPLHGYQLAFRPGVGTEVALHNIITIIEKSLYCGQFTLGIFLDIEGAFDNATFQSIKTSLNGRDIDEAIQGWIINMLINRKAIIDIKGVQITKNLTKGVPQGGILSPILWNFILESLLDLFRSSPVFTQGYADDVALLLSGRDPNILVDYMNGILTKISRWGREKHLTFNPNKTIAIMFTNKRS